MGRVIALKPTDPSDTFLVRQAQEGDKEAYQKLMQRYEGFVRVKAASSGYNIQGGSWDDLFQEGRVGLMKAIRDFKSERCSSFRNFADLCISRQLATAVKSATRGKHTPLNRFISFSSTPAGAGDDVPTLEEILPGPVAHDPVNQIISSEKLGALVKCLASSLSELESRVLSLYLDGDTYEQIAESVGRDTKAVDNALVRIRSKTGSHLALREAA
jgi:RNA polymerase sporulation-specific sigma factor